jgi:hypothetical protein
MTTGESACFALLDGDSSAFETRGPSTRPSQGRSRTRFWLLVMIETLLLATVLAIFWCQSKSQPRPAPTPQDFTPPPLGNFVAAGSIPTPSLQLRPTHISIAP